MDTTLRIEGIDVFVEGVEGEGGDTVVMIHGWPDTYRMWDAQVAGFRERLRCVRFSLPGFELSKPCRPMSWASTVRLIDKVVEATSPGRPVVLMVHDWGCVFGYQYAMSHPHRVRAVVGVDVGDAGSRPHLRSLSAVDKAMIAAYQGWLALAWRIGGRPGDAMTRLVARVARLAGGPNEPRHTGVCMDYPYYFLWTGAYGAYTHRVNFRPPCPMLYLYGRRKPFMLHSPRWIEDLSGRPGDRAIGFDTGHWVMVERPAEFNRAVLDWLGRA